MVLCLIMFPFDIPHCACHTLMESKKNIFLSFQVFLNQSRHSTASLKMSDIFQF